MGNPIQTMSKSIILALIVVAAVSALSDDATPEQDFVEAVESGDWFAPSELSLLQTAADRYRYGRPTHREEESLIQTARRTTEWSSSIKSKYHRKKGGWLNKIKFSEKKFKSWKKNKSKKNKSEMKQALQNRWKIQRRARATRRGHRWKKQFRT